MILRAVHERPPYPNHGVIIQRNWAVITPQQIRLADLTTTRAILDLCSFLDDDSTSYDDLFAHVVSFKGDPYLEIGLHRVLCAAPQGRTAIHARILEVTEEGVPRLVPAPSSARPLSAASGNPPSTLAHGSVPCHIEPTTT